MRQNCLISITASHYRSLIYKLLDIELKFDFIFGDDDTTVKKMDTSTLSRSSTILNRYLYGPFYYQPGLCGKIKNYDIIINDLGIFCLTAWKLLIFSKLRRKKIYSWGHGWYGREGLVKKWIKRAYYALSDGALIYGNYARELMIQNGFNGNKLHVIHNSLDYDTQLTIRNGLYTTNFYSEHFGNDNRVICFIGRLTKVKKLDLLLDALVILKDKSVIYNLVLIGDGEMKEDLIRKVDEYDIKNQVWFYGPCYNERTNAELIYNSDLCVAPGNIGLTAMHAMMFGCPCLSHNDFPWQMPEFEAIVDGVTGTFFERDNVSSLAENINRWFVEKENVREEVRLACYREIDENWNPHKQIEIIKRVING